ncbi:MAG: DUF1016 N-terminal domain-containing protein [Burkholderiales bacterium]
MSGRKKTVASIAVPMALLGDIRRLIDSARERAASAVNSEEILPTLSAELVPVYGKGFSACSLARMVQFAEVFPEEEIVATLSQQLMSEYGKGFSYTALTRMAKIYETYRADKKVASLLRQLPWTHHLMILGRSRFPEIKSEFDKLIGSLLLEKA